MSYELHSSDADAMSSLVAPPAPAASEAQSGAPSANGSTPLVPPPEPTLPPIDTLPGQEGKGDAKPDLMDLDDNKEGAGLDGAGPAVALPKGPEVSTEPPKPFEATSLPKPLGVSSLPPKPPTEGSADQKPVGSTTLPSLSSTLPQHSGSTTLPTFESTLPKPTEATALPTINSSLPKPPAESTTLPGIGSALPKPAESTALPSIGSTLSKPADPITTSKPEDSLSVPSAPKPVEVLSVPQTPANSGTPAGGTPRPELKIAEEPEKPREDLDKAAFVGTGLQEPRSTPKTSLPEEDSIPEPITDAPLGTNGVSSKPAEMTGALQTDTPPAQPPTSLPTKPVTAEEEASKAAEITTAPPPPTSLPTKSEAASEPKSVSAETTTAPVSLPTEAAPVAAPTSLATESAPAAELATGEKRKLEEPAMADTVMASATNGPGEVTQDEPDQKRVKPNGQEDTPPKTGRPRKVSKPKPPPVVGRTERKTRSQGPADGSKAA